MLRKLREGARAKLGRALQEYVVAELRPDLDRVADGLRHELGDVRRQLTAAEEQIRGLESSMRAWEHRQRRDLFTMREQAAARSAAEFQVREMPLATAWFGKEETLTAAVKAAPTDGLYLEFGVHTGGTLRAISELAPPGSVYGFDSFEGLPEDWREEFTAGTFALDAPPEVPGAELVVGWFEETLPGFLEQHPEPVAFLHLDADLYSSTKTVLDALEGRLRAGTVVLFDEYFNFPGWQDHEHRAWTEFVGRTRIGFEYLGYTADDEQVSLRITEVPPR